MDQKQPASFKEFYSFYLTEHSNATSRILHFTGTTAFFVLLIAGIVTKNYLFFIFIPIAGYGFAWIGHFFFEKNKPATFKHPFYSLLSDFVLYFQLISGKEKFGKKK